MFCLDSSLVLYLHAGVSVFIQVFLMFKYFEWQEIGSYRNDWIHAGFIIDSTHATGTVFLNKCQYGYKLETNIMLSKKISNDQELIQSNPTSCPENQKKKYLKLTAVYERHSW